MTPTLEAALSRWSAAHQQLLANERLFGEMLRTTGSNLAGIGERRGDLELERKQVDLLLTEAMALLPVSPDAVS